MSSPPRHLFFCAVGGSGMLPLALLMKARGCTVSGSDRARDQGRTPERFAWIEKQGIALYPQDGSGVTCAVDAVIASAAVEATVPDVAEAMRQGLRLHTRAELLAAVFNETPDRIAVAGTSGKSTTTGMLGWILHQAKKDPTIVNGAGMKNFQTTSDPYGLMVAGDESLLVAEVDESDGSIAKYNPTLAILNNVSLDHKSMDELRALFGAYLDRAEKIVVNADDPEASVLAASLPREKVLTFSLHEPTADIYAQNKEYCGFSTQLTLRHKNTPERVKITLPLPGQHNTANALAAITAAVAYGLPFAHSATSLASFTGIARRMDKVGTVRGVTVIDDFAHNPDKIAASLRALNALREDAGASGRVFVLFQPHGYGPLNLMRRELATCFAQGLKPQDRLLLTEPLYLGGTVNRKVTAQDIVNDIHAQSGNARLAETRSAAIMAMAREAKSGDILVVMGARDDTLTTLAHDLLGLLEKSPVS